MFKKIILLTFLYCFSALLTAQQLIPLDEETYLNEINKEIKSGTKNSALEAHLKLSEYWAATDSLKSWTALQLVITSTEKKYLAKGLIDYYLGVYYTQQGSKRKAKAHYNNAIKLLKENINSKTSRYLIKSLYNNAYNLVEDNGYDFMVKTLTEECIPLSQKYKHTDLLAYNYTQLGLTFMSVGQFQKAEEYHKKALIELKKTQNPDTIHLLTYFNLVSNYCYKPDSKTAKLYLDKAKNIIDKYPKSQHFANYYYQEAMYFTTKQTYDKALKSLTKGAEIAKNTNQPKLLHLIYFRMYNVYLMQKDYVKAKQQLEVILKENILSKEAVNKKITYTQLAAVNNVLGDHKEAYNWMKKSSLLGDSLQQQKLLEKMNELEILHQTSDKQQRIDKLEQEKKETALITKNKNLRITILAIALILSLIIAFLIFRTYKNQQKINSHIKINHQQNLLHLANNRKHEATQAVLQGEEQERQRIAQDLHDSIGGMLANIRMTISSNTNNTTDGLLIKIDKSIAEMRRISRNLMPETLKNLGLEIAIKELCESMSQKNFSIQFEAFNVSNNIPFQTQLALYRITQESISNTIKYAHANTIIVQLSQNENLLSLTIEDDGIGFDKATITPGLGLKNIENRVKLINGKLDIISEKGQGTTINVDCNV